MGNTEADLDDPQGDFLTGFCLAVGVGLGLLALVAATAYGFKFINDYEGARITALIVHDRAQAHLNEMLAADHAALLTNVQRGPVKVMVGGERAMTCRAK